MDETPRPYHHGDLRTALVRAALDLVRERGPRGFTLAEASRRAGVSVAAPYRHFRDKEALIAEAIREGNELMAEELRAAADAASGVEEGLLAVGMAYVRFAAVHADYFTLIFGSGIDKSRHPAIGDSAARAFGVALELAERDGGSPDRARRQAVALWATAHGLAVLGASGDLAVADARLGDETELREALRQILR